MQPTFQHKSGTETGSISAAIRSLRQSRGFTQEALARQAGVNVSTLSRWESGKRAPSIPELEAVLAALGVGDSERRQVLQAHHAPRAIRHLREIVGAATPPVGGDLLWAMRLRKGWTQMEAARTVGVTQAQIARWEKAESWPRAEMLHTLCWHLNARPEEVAALTTGIAQEPAIDEPQNRDEWAIFVKSLLLEGPPSEELLDLAMLSVECRLSRLGTQHSYATELLPMVYSIHARHHFSRQRTRQSAFWAERGLALIRGKDALPSNVREAFWFGNVIAIATHAAQGGRRAGVRQAVRILQTWLPLVPEKDPHHAWGMSELALHLSVLGKTAEAIAVGEAACQKARAIRPNEEFCRFRQQARLLADVGKHAQALSTLKKGYRFADFNAVGVATAASDQLLEAECYLALGAHGEANERLHTVEQAIHSHNLPTLKANLSRIAAQL